MTNWLARAQTVFQEKPEPAVPKKAAQHTPVADSDTAKPNPPLSPEIETLVRKAAVHYQAPEELPLMLEAARADPEGATIYYRRLCAGSDYG